MSFDGVGQSLVCGMKMLPCWKLAVPGSSVGLGESGSLAAGFWEIFYCYCFLVILFIFGSFKLHMTVESILTYYIYMD